MSRFKHPTVKRSLKSQFGCKPSIGVKEQEHPMSTLRTLYQAIDPYQVGVLEVGDGHVLHWERIGTARRKASRFPPWRPGRRVYAEQPASLRPFRV